MNFPFFIARRYVFSKKSTNAINVISAISVVGVAVGTMALVIVLSVFNGFHDLVASFFTNFDPQIELVPTQGKTAPADDPVLDQIRKMPEVSVHTDVLEDQGLAVYGDRQQMVTVMGVDENFTQLTNISDILYGDGEFHRFRTPTVRSGRHALVATDTTEAGQRPRGCEETDARDCRLEV